MKFSWQVKDDMSYDKYNFGGVPFLPTGSVYLSATLWKIISTDFNEKSDLIQETVGKMVGGVFRITVWIQELFFE